jgi:hypothetical protein
MKHFPEDTRDPIEQIYARKILRRFPKYGEFWNRFVGIKDRGTYLLPYGLRIPGTISVPERKQIRQAYEEICMAHYSLFCHLAGAHFQVDKLRVLSPLSSKWSWLKHWETFESVYLHLGICFNEVYHLWDLVFLMRGQLGRKKDGTIGRTSGGPSPSSLRESEFRNARKLRIFKDFKHLSNEISARRNNITHYSRGASRSIRSKIYVPVYVRQNVPWRMEFRAKKWWETSLKASLDLRRTECAVNSNHEVLITSLEDYLSNKGIRIQR